MRNAFVDLGSFRGDIIRKYMASPLYLPDDVIHAFEPNPIIPEAFFLLYPQQAIIHREAAWTENGTIDLYVNKNNRKDVQGTSICNGKTTGDLDFDHPKQVKCIDFPYFLRSLFCEIEGGKIRVKMNIEGAEYPLLNKMCDDGSINIIDTLYLRVHWHKIGMAETENDALINRLTSVKTLTLKRDYSF